MLQRPTPAFRSNVPLSARLKWITTGLFGVSFAGVLAWMVATALARGIVIVPAGPRASRYVPLEHGGTAVVLSLVMWTGAILFFALTGCGALREAFKRDPLTLD